MQLNKGNDRFMSTPIYFVINRIPDSLKPLLAEDQRLPAPTHFKPDSQTARDTHWYWIGQTFLYLKQAGLNVSLVEQPVPNAICITHFDLTKNKVWAADSFVVGIRADRSPCRMCEVELVQSPANLGRSRSFLIPYWPQARLIPRLPERGNQIEQLSYFGGEGGLSPQFRDAEFINALQDLGVTFNFVTNPDQWNDYSTTDLVIAVRNDLHPLLLNTKPASKLINAWQAGCVALLGNEPAYQAAGIPGRHYFEVSSPQDVLETVRQLKANPSLYEQVREAGIARYADYDFEAVQQQWVNLLTGRVAKAFHQWQQAKKSSAYRRLRRTRQSVHQWVDHKLFYLPVRADQFLQKIAREAD